MPEPRRLPANPIDILDSLYMCATSTRGMMKLLHALRYLRKHLETSGNV